MSYHWDIKFWKYKDLHTIAKHTIHKYTIKNSFQRGYVLCIFCMSLSSEITMVIPFLFHFLFVKIHELPLLLFYLWAVLRQKGFFASPPPPFSLLRTIRFYFVIFRNFQSLSCCLSLINFEQETVSTTSYVFCNHLKFLIQSQKLPSLGSQGPYFPRYENNITEKMGACPSEERTSKSQS